MYNAEPRTPLEKAMARMLASAEDSERGRAIGLDDDFILGARSAAYAAAVIALGTENPIKGDHHEALRRVGFPDELLDSVEMLASMYS